MDAQIASLVRKSQPHEQLFALLSGKSCKDSTLAAMRSSPDMMKVAAGLRQNRNDTLFQNAWNRGCNACLERAGLTLAALRAAVTAFVADPSAAPQSVKTKFGTITLSRAEGGAMREVLIHFWSEDPALESKALDSLHGHPGLRFWNHRGVVYLRDQLPTGS